MVSHYNKCQPKDSYSLVTSIIMDIIKSAILRKSSDIFGDNSCHNSGGNSEDDFQKKEIINHFEAPQQEWFPATTNVNPTIPTYQGGFQLLDLIIPELKSHVIPYKIKSSHWLKLQHSDLRANLVKDFFLQINFPPMRALEFIRDHMTFKLRYNQIQ